MAIPESTKQNITVPLDRRTLRKAEVSAAKRNTSINGLLAARIEALVDEDAAYEQAHRRAVALLDRAFPPAAGSRRPVTGGTSVRTAVG